MPEAGKTGEVTPSVLACGLGPLKNSKKKLMMGCLLTFMSLILKTNIQSFFFLVECIISSSFLDLLAAYFVDMEAIAALFFLPKENL